MKNRPRIVGAGWVWVLALVLSVLTVSARGGTLTATQGNVTILYDPTCSGTPTLYTLGSFSITLANAGTGNNFTNMSATFTVNTGAGAPPAGLFDCARFHWYQNVETLPPNDIATYQGVSASNALPITDPPKGGWDYMYLDGSGRTNPDPAFSGTFIDNNPWYFTAAGEAANSTVGSSYTITDGAAKRAGNSPYGVQFLTYFTADVANEECTDEGCLLPNQVLVLGGFAWHTGTNGGSGNFDPGIESTFPGPLTGSVADVQSGLTNAGFSTWTAVSSETTAICCAAPEPASLAMLGCGALGLLIRRRGLRQAA